MDIRTAIDSFRTSLRQFGDLQGMYGNPEMDVAYDALVNEFSHWFKEFEKPSHLGPLAKPMSLTAAVHKYCDKNIGHCPICSRPMVQRMNSKTKNKFLGCPGYPECRGARDKDGRISMNGALRTFLLEKMMTKPEPKVELTRFDMIETDDE